MPGKSKAFDKPTINAAHKTESAKVARLLSETSSSKRSGMSLEMCKIIEQSALDADRQRHACRTIDEACAKLDRGVHPLEGLKPPPTCAPCGGSKGGTHHFLCQKRVLQPSAPEKGVRASIVSKFQAAWRARQHALQQVRIHALSTPGHACYSAAPQDGRLLIAFSRVAHSCPFAY